MTSPTEQPAPALDIDASLTDIERSLNLLLNVTPVFLLEGKILERDGTLAAFRRVPTGNDPRANISKGGRAVPLEIDAESPGGMQAVERLYEVDVCPTIIEALERRTGSPS